MARKVKIKRKHLATLANAADQLWCTLDPMEPKARKLQAALDIADDVIAEAAWNG